MTDIATPPKPDGFSDSAHAQVQPGTQGTVTPPVVSAPQQASSAPRPKKKHTALWVVLGVVAALLLSFAFTIHSCTSMIGSVMADGEPYEGNIGQNNTIGIVSLEGEIGYDGTLSSPAGFREMLKMAEEDPNVKALVLRVNSGGGSATAGEEMSEALQRFSKPVVVSSASINASAAYMISAQAQYIFVAKTTEIGAIGTGMTFTDLSGLYDKLGIKRTDITSTPNKDSSWGNRPLTAEEIAYYQNMVNEINSTFIDMVAQGRGMNRAQVETLATGMTFAGTTAVKNGIADEVGYLQDAEAKAAQLAGIDDWNAHELHFKSKNVGFDLLDLVGFSEFKQFSEFKKELIAHDLYSK